MPDALNDKAVSKPCPICGKPSQAGQLPFCSKRCADIDLHRWLGGRYAIPIPGDNGGIAQTDGDDDEASL